MAASNLPTTKITKYWRTQGGQVPDTYLYQMTATTANVPVGGDLCHLDSAGLIEVLGTTASSATAAARTIAGVLTQEGNIGNTIYNPGLQAETWDYQRTMNIGGRGQFVGSSGPVNQRFMAPMKDTLSWVMTRYTDDPVVVGQAYGYRRVDALNRFIDASIPDDTLVVIGFFEPDVDGLFGPAFKAIPRVWVKAALPGNL